MTKKLYEIDSYCKKTSAIVVSCEHDETGYTAVLNETIFFPEGGGQAADKGTINGIEVLDVVLKDGVIYHKLESEVKAGEEVVLELDWPLRYSRMQSHTGEHILSGIVHSLFGYDNVGFHMSENTMLVDFNGALSPNDIEKIELECNMAIYKNADIVATYHSPDEAKNLDFRSKIDIKDEIRIISIGDDIDRCACCAPHLLKTGEVGLIKIIDFSSYKQGTRIEMTAGINALKDYINLNKSNKELMKMFSAPRDGVKNAILDQSASYQALKNEFNQISKKLALHELERNEVKNAVYCFSKGLNFDELRYCASHLIEKYATCILLSEIDDENFMYVVQSKDDDIKLIVDSINENFSGKGGGRGDYYQGKLSSSKDVIIKGVEKLLSER